jgi:xylose isomerase
MDTMAHALVVAAALVEDAALEDVRSQRYAGWEADLGARIMGGEESLASLHERGLGTGEPTRRSGGQEAAENLVARYIDQAR